MKTPKGNVVMTNQMENFYYEMFLYIFLVLKGFSFHTSITCAHYG